MSQTIQLDPHAQRHLLDVAEVLLAAARITVRQGGWHDEHVALLQVRIQQGTMVMPGMNPDLERHVRCLVVCHPDYGWNRHPFTPVLPL